MFGQLITFFVRHDVRFEFLDLADNKHSGSFFSLLVLNTSFNEIRPEIQLESKSIQIWISSCQMDKDKLKKN